MCNAKCSSNVWKIIYRVLTSNFGLSIAVLLYSVMGAALFQRIDKDEGERNKDMIRTIRENCLKNLWDYTESLNVLYKENWTSVVEESLKKFENDVVIATKKFKYDGPNKKETTSFGESLLYAVTLITTVGNCPLSLSSEGGRITTILYSLFGIPITLLFLTRSGILLADGVRKIFHLICRCDLCSGNRQQLKTQNEIGILNLKMDDSVLGEVALYSRQNNVSLICENLKNSVKDDTGLHRIDSENYEEETEFNENHLKGIESDSSGRHNSSGNEYDEADAVHARMKSRLDQESFAGLFTPTSTTSLSRVDHEPTFNVDITSDKKRPLTDLPKRKQFDSTTSPLDLASTEVLLNTRDLSDLSNYNCIPLSEKNTQENRKFERIIDCHNSLKTDVPSDHVLKNNVPVWLLKKKQDAQSLKLHNVPIALVLLFLVAYILLGGVILSKYEGWTFPEGTYFSFMALLTIGFAEPSMIGKIGRGRESPIVICLYLVFGLILVAMCLNLIQTRARNY